MWLYTTQGFYSIVRKPEDEERGTLTVRARFAGDLERLRDRYLPTLTNTIVTPSGDYRYRAQAPQGDVAAAFTDALRELTYSNFKTAVAFEHSPERADVYHDVWDVMFGHQQQAVARRRMPMRKLGR